MANMMFKIIKPRHGYFFKFGFRFAVKSSSFTIGFFSKDPAWGLSKFNFWDAKDYHLDLGPLHLAIEYKP